MAISERSKWFHSNAVEEVTVRQPKYVRTRIISSFNKCREKCNSSANSDHKIVDQTCLDFTYKIIIIGNKQAMELSHAWMDNRLNTKKNKSE